MDLSIILNDWPFDEEEDANNVRKIVGMDGLPKLQLRLRNGIIQWEIKGRPDGARPYGFPTVQEYCDELIQSQHSLSETGAQDEVALNDSLIRELRDELVAFLKRGLVLIKVEDYANAASDADHSLRVLNLIKNYGNDTVMTQQCEHYRPRLLMERARARALESVQKDAPEEAIKTLTDTIEAIEESGRLSSMSGQDVARERKTLIDFRRSLRERYRIPLTDTELLQTLRLEQEVAIEEENYEMAAHLRDKITLLREKLGDKV